MILGNAATSGDPGFIISYVEGLSFIGAFRTMVKNHDVYTLLYAFGSRIGTFAGEDTWGGVSAFTRHHHTFVALATHIARALILVAIAVSS